VPKSALRVVVVQEVVVPRVIVSVTPVFVEVITPPVIVPLWTAAAAGLAMAIRTMTAMPTAATERPRYALFTFSP
jgi:hypothetical protein